MSSPITTPGDRVSVRIVTIQEENSPNGPFFFLSVANDPDPRPGYIRLNHRGGLVVTPELWVQLLATIVKTGAQAQMEMSKGKNPAPYICFDKLVKLVIELTSPIKIVRKGGGYVNAISGNIIEVSSRRKGDDFDFD